ncbi:MAG TPA: hypothetical protein VJ767_11290 [Nitrososphaeraceae archaeon]|nr:hypothetical protein [Nitrososphaeraceae archaeon]
MFYSNAYAHTFSSDESASFLITIDEIKAQGDLIQMAINSKDTESIISHMNKLKDLYSEDINKEISEKSKRISTEIYSIVNSINSTNYDEPNIKSKMLGLNDVLDESISIRLSPGAENNSTVQALRFAGLVNSIDKYYVKTFHKEPMNMSQMNKMKKNHGSIMPMNPKDNQSLITDSTAYNTAKKLLITLKSVFDSKLKQADLKTGDNSLDIINKGLENLTSTINDKKPYEEAMKIIHGIIQPTLQEKFNLKLDQALSAKPSNNTKEHLPNMTVH